MSCPVKHGSAHSPTARLSSPQLSSTELTSTELTSTELTSTEPFTRDQQGAIQLFGSDYVRDPYRVFDQLTRRGPVHRVLFPSGVYAWLVTGADAARELMSHPAIRKNHDYGNATWRAKASIMPEPQHSRLQSHLLHQDGQIHASMRKLILPAFSAKAAAQLAPWIQSAADRLIDAFPAEGSLDLVKEFMAILPFQVLAQAIGLPEQLASQFDRSWGQVVRPVGPDDPWRPEYERLLRELEAYIALIIEDRSAPGSTGLLAELVRAARTGTDSGAEPTLTDNQLGSLIFQLLVAGQEPVTHQLSTSLLALLTHPEALATFQSASGNREHMVDELIRYDGAFALATWRFFAEDTEFQGQLIPAGDSVIVALNAANRDAAHGAELDFDGARSNHFGFGSGPHYCPGSALARKQLAIGLGSLVDRLVGPELDGTAEDWVAAVLNRGLHRLQVRYRAVQ